MSLRWLACSITLIVLCSSCESSSGDGAKPDASIYNELTHIQAIDNHAHPSKMLAPGELDVDADALPPDAISDLALPTPMLEGSPYIPQAWHALFKYTSTTKESQMQSQELLRKREDLQKSKGDGYPVWVLNQLDTAVMLSNRVAMGRGLNGRRVKWESFVYEFLFLVLN